MDWNSIYQFTGVTSKAAIAAAAYNGRGDKVAADQAATEAMRNAFNDIPFAGRVVIGEGERDEAPMLYIGEELGRGGGKTDIAVDPLEGTNLCAYNRRNALTTLAMTPTGGLLHAPDTYMWKLAAPVQVLGSGMSLARDIDVNLKILSRELGRPIADLNVCVLKRDRHDKLIKDIRATGARISLIDDGDVQAAIAAVLPGTGIDLYIGSGGSPEGVLAAAGIKALGGFFEGKLDFALDSKGAEKRIRAQKMSPDLDLDSILTIDTLVPGNDIVFIASGVTDGDFVKGVRLSDDKRLATVSSIVVTSTDGLIRLERQFAL